MTQHTLISENKCFGGTQYVYSHAALTTHCAMRFGIYLPPQAKVVSVPAVYWLSGLTCTEENFIIKAGAQRIAAELGLAIITPDTSPRGNGVPGNNEAYDFGLGASYYLDATLTPWASHYQMYSYITQELPKCIVDFPIDTNRMAISGHSMGGHGALMLALKNPGYFKSVSAFAPICSVMESPWGINALERYLGENRTEWQAYDVCALIKAHGWQGPSILIDQGAMDPYLKEQLKPELLIHAAEVANIDVQFRFQEGYNHSYFFIATFIRDHLQFHAENLNRLK